MRTATGQLRHRGEIQADVGEPVDGADEIGQPRERWRTLFRSWLSIEPLSGREYWQAAQVQADVTHRIRARYQDAWRDVTAGCRVLWQGRAYHLIEPPRVLEERGLWVEVLAREVVT